MQTLTGDRNPEARMRALTLLSGLPAIATTAWLLSESALETSTRVLILLGVILPWWLAAFAGLHGLRYTLRTLSNLISSLREGDYSFRVRGGCRAQPIGELILEINALADQLRTSRLDERETAGLLRSVMEEIDVAIFAFAPDRRLRLANRAGQRLLGADPAQLLGRTADDLGLAECLEAEPARTLDRSPGGSMGRWALRRTAFRQDGLPHTLVVLTDLSRALREEERLAWQRIVRVLGHEINNSLAPVMSIAGSLDRLVATHRHTEEWLADVADGLSVIRSRAEALNRFMQAYAKLARLPVPMRQPVDVAAWVRRATALETRVPVAIRDGPAAIFAADPDQLDQLLINLIRNAADAALSRTQPSPDPPVVSPEVWVGWQITPEAVEVTVEDNGPGLGNTANLFVPFFTTKPGGSGIGLALCRQIAEAHGGSVSLRNRVDAPGCLARVSLPRIAARIDATP